MLLLLDASPASFNDAITYWCTVASATGWLSFVRSKDHSNQLWRAHQPSLAAYSWTHQVQGCRLGIQGPPPLCTVVPWPVHLRCRPSKSPRATLFLQRLPRTTSRSPLHFGSRAFSLLAPRRGTACHRRLRRHRLWQPSALDSRRFCSLSHILAFGSSGLQTHIVDLAVFSILRPLWKFTIDWFIDWTRCDPRCMAVEPQGEAGAGVIGPRPTSKTVNDAFNNRALLVRQAEWQCQRKVVKTARICLVTQGIGVHRGRSGISHKKLQKLKQKYEINVYLYKI